MRLIVITANLMQRLSGLPATPDITLLDLRKPKPHPRSHTNTTFREPTYIRWCCIDLSNAPPKPDKWNFCQKHFSGNATIRPLTSPVAPLCRRDCTCAARFKFCETTCYLVH